MSYIRTNLITTLTDVMAARIAHSRRMACNNQQEQMGKQFGCKYRLVQNLVCEYVLGLTHTHKLLSGMQRNKEDTKGPFTQTPKETPELHSKSPEFLLVLGKAQWASNLLYFLRLQNSFQVPHSRERMAKICFPHAVRHMPTSG